MNYNNEKYALLEDGTIEPLYYDLNGEIVKDSDNARHFDKDKKGNWELYHVKYLGFCILLETKSRIIKFGNSKEELLKFWKENKNDK